MYIIHQQRHSSYPCCQMSAGQVNEGLPKKVEYHPGAIITYTQAKTNRILRSTPSVDYKKRSTLMPPQLHGKDYQIQIGSWAPPSISSVRAGGKTQWQAKTGREEALPAKPPAKSSSSRWDDEGNALGSPKKKKAAWLEELNDMEVHVHKKNISQRICNRASWVVNH